MKKLSSEVRLDAFSLTDIGRVRSHNEDSAGLIKGPGFIVLSVFDGMGGHQRGEVASSLALNTIKEVFEPLSKAPSPTAAKRLIRSALKEANSRVIEMAKARPECHGMGTTAVVALVLEKVTIVASLGDSRAYILKPDRVTIKQITQDDSYVRLLVERGTITRQQARSHPDRNIITNALGIKDRMTCHIQEIPNDYTYIMLCSDGLYTMVTDGSIGRILRKDTDVQHKVIALINTANDAGGKDNISVALLERRRA